MNEMFLFSWHELNDSFERAIKWYKSLSIHSKINLKALSFIICGVDWSDFSILFSPRERLVILYDKLNQLGFNLK